MRMRGGRCGEHAGCKCGQPRYGRSELRWLGDWPVNAAFNACCCGANVGHPASEACKWMRGGIGANVVSKPLQEPGELHRKRYSGSGAATCSCRG
jgi:hypothetical protein